MFQNRRIDQRGNCRDSFDHKICASGVVPVTNINITMEDAMGNMVEQQIVVGVMEHLSSKDLMMKFGSVSNYLVRMIIYIITVVHERVSDGLMMVTPGTWWHACLLLPYWNLLLAPRAVEVESSSLSVTTCSIYKLKR